MWLPGHRPRRHRHPDGGRAQAASEKEGKTRHDLGREAFLERVWEWRRAVAAIGSSSSSSCSGCSLDWDRADASRWTRPTRAAVSEAFVRLYEEGLIYRAERLINWCVVLPDRAVRPRGRVRRGRRRASSTSSPTRWPTVRARWWWRPPAPRRCWATPPSPCTPTIRATRRRSASSCSHPFVERQIPIIADAILVDPKFGTGAVKVTPAHDSNDFETGQRHGLPMISILDEKGTVNAEGGAFAGLDRFAARKAVKAAPEGAGPRARVEAARARGRPLPALRHRGRADAVDAVVREDGAAGRAGDRGGGEGKTRFVPESWTKTYFHWMRNIRDWCISRQLWWGHRIPAWYCAACGEITVARTDAGGLRQVRRRPSCSRTRTCSTPGSRPGCGRSRRWAGRTRRAS